MEKTCKECEYYEEAIKAAFEYPFIMNCPKYGKSQSLDRCGHFTPKKPKEEKKERDHQAHIGLLNSRLQSQKKQINGYKDYIAEILCNEPPKQKENKMSTLSKIFYPIRRYVAGCAIYCTVKIAIFLNLPVFHIAAIIKPAYRTAGTTYSGVTNELLKPEIPWDSGDTKQIAVVWSIAILACVGILFALWLYNQFCKRLFGEK